MIDSIAKLHFIFQQYNKYGSVQELRSTFGHHKSFKRLA